MWRFTLKKQVLPWDHWRVESKVMALCAATLFITLVGAPNRTQFIYFQF